MRAGRITFPIRFEYPGIYRLWGSTMAVLGLVTGFLLSVLLLSQPRPSQERWIIVGLVAISCGVLVTTGLYLFVTCSARLILTEHSITWIRFSQRRTLDYQKIFRAHYGTTIPRLILTAPTGQIAIARWIENYDELYTLLRTHVPILRDAARMPFPLEITAPLGNLIGYWALSLMPLGLAVMIGYSPTRYASSLALAVGLIIVLVGITAVLIYYFLLKPPWRYTFTDRQITTQSLLGKRIFDATLIQSIRMDKTISTRWGVDRTIYSIVIEFSDGRRLVIEQGATRYPFEQLWATLHHHYGMGR